MGITKESIIQMIQSDQIQLRGTLTIDDYKLCIKTCTAIVKSDKNKDIHKLNALKIIQYNTQELVQQITNDKSLATEVKQLAMTNQNTDVVRLALECIKYWGTRMLIPMYTQIIQQLIEDDIDLPNSYTYFIEYSEQELLAQYQTIITQQLLDEQAFQDILQHHQEPSQILQSILLTYYEQFQDRQFQINRLINGNQGIFIADQLQQLQIIELFIIKYNNCYEDLRKHQFKLKYYQQFQDALLRNSIKQAKSQLINPNVKDVVGQINQNFWSPEKQQLPMPVVPQVMNQSTLQQQHQQVNIKSQSNSQSQGNIASQSQLMQQQPHSITRNSNIQDKFNIYFEQEFAKLQLRQPKPIKVKIHSGQIIEQPNYEHLKGLNTLQLKKLKQCCLKERSIIFDSHELQIGISTELWNNHGEFSNQLIIDLVVGNKTKQTFESCELICEESKGTDVWIQEEYLQSIAYHKQGRFKLIVNYNQLFYQPIQCQFQWHNEKLKFKAPFILPSLLAKFMDFKPIVRKYFKWKWHEKRLFIMRSPVFKLNSDIIKTPLDFQKYFKELSFLTPYQSVLSGESDLKLGGMFTLRDIRRNYLVKFIIKVDMSCVIKIEGLQEAECLLQCLQFILEQ